MKNIFLLIIVVLSVQIGLAQVKTNVPATGTTVKRITTAQVKTIPSAKATVIRKNTVQLKAQLTQFNDSVALVKREIDELAGKMKSDPDNMSEMGETESLRLQMAMDRLSKAMSTLSNLMKKINETSQSITQNLK